MLPLLKISKNDVFEIGSEIIYELTSDLADSIDVLWVNMHFFELI